MKFKTINILLKKSMVESQNILFFLFVRGDDFRKDYSQLAMLCATFPQVPVVALTATASKADVKAIKDSLNMKKPLEVIGDPNRANIFYEKVFRKGDDIEFFEELLKPMASELKEVTLNYPLTIVYLPLKWCGFAFKFFEKQLGNEQYYPLEAEALPENRLFAQYHAPQTTAMKDQILKELALPASKVRIIFATVALGMGVNIPSIRSFMLDHHVQFRTIFKKLEGQVEMGSLQLRYCTSTIATLLKIEKE